MAAAPTTISKPGSARDTFIENRMRLPVGGHQGSRSIAPRQRLLSGNIHTVCETVARLGRLLLITPRLGFTLGFELSGQLS